MRRLLACLAATAATIAIVMTPTLSLADFTGNAPPQLSPPPVEAPNGMAVTSQHYASQVGANILKAGGNAVDAAVAIGYALAVTHPCCGNIGGGGFATIHLANGKNTFIDFREKAPAAASELQAIAYVLSQDLGEGDLRIGPDVGIGAAVFPTDAGDLAALLTRAFAAMPKPGQRADGRVAFYSAQASDAARERFAIEQGLRHAIAREQFLLHYQPVFDLVEGRAVGAEALLRWRHPELGLVPPGRFIPVLEQSGLMEEVGLWVLNAACRQARAWEDQGLTGLRMSVNLSARQCRDPAFATVILRTVERHGLRPEALELELTETAAMEDADRTRALLGELRAMGMGVALDDFGAGYSSLSYLKNLPFSKLKIDREFVTMVDQRRDSRAICAALVELAKGLEITVLAEGVETREEVETLRELGCSMFQGFYFARPTPAAEFAAAISDPAWRQAEVIRS